MDYGADDPQGMEQQIYLQELIRNHPNISRVIAAAQGQYDGMGITPVDPAQYPAQYPAQDRYSSNMRQAFPMEYYAGRVGGNVVGNPAGIGKTVSPLIKALMGR